MKSQDINKRVRVTKAGTFNGLEGEIIEVKATVRFKSIGDWSFSLSDLVLSTSTKGVNEPNEPQIKPQEAIIPENGTTDKPKAVKAHKAVKKPVAKKIKNGQPKEKRKYTRKEK